MKEQIEFSEFLEIEKKLEIKYGMITSSEEVPKSKKLLKLTVEFGTVDKPDTRTVVTNIKESLIHCNLTSTPASYLIGAGTFFVTNLKPVMIMGIESTAMICPLKTDEGEMKFGVCYKGLNVL